MDYDKAAADRVRRIVSGRPGVAEKRMVGGLSFTVGGSMCCGITGNDLMIRDGAERRDAVLELPHVHPMKIGGRALAGFVCVEPAGYQTDAALVQWIERSIDFTGTLRSRPRPRDKPQALWQRGATQAWSSRWVRSQASRLGPAGAGLGPRHWRSTAGSSRWSRAAVNWFSNCPRSGWRPCWQPNMAVRSVLGRAGR